MKDFTLLLSSALCAIVGLAVVIANLHTPTTAVLMFSAAFLVLALALAIPAQLGGAIKTCTPFFPKSLRGGTPDAPQ